LPSKNLSAFSRAFRGTSGT